MLIDSLKWYAWIPTNLGILDYNFITFYQMSLNFGKNIKFSKDKENSRFWNLDLKNFKDSLSPSFTSVSIEEEIIPIGVISFQPYYNNKVLKGIVIINYPDNFKVSFDYYLEENGKICIYNPRFSDTNQMQYIDKSLLTTFAQMIYMIVKQSLHGDSHHHQKIDYVIKVQQNIFPANRIIYTFAKHIKNVERDIKSLDTCRGHLKAINSIEEIRGYISYANTFYELNKDKMNHNSKILVKNMQNVIISLEATVAKKNNHFKYLDVSKTTFLTIFTLVISLSLMLFKDIIHNNITIVDRYIEFNILGNTFLLEWYMFFFSLFLFGLSIFYWLRKCYIKSYIFYNHYNIYEAYKYISWISLKESSFKYYLIKIIIPITIIMVSSYFIVI